MTKFLIFLMILSIATLACALQPDEVSFDYVKSLKNCTTVLLIDVRKPPELEKTGIIPGSINIPLAALGETLQNASVEEFQAKYNRAKPKLETPLVFYCREGNRSKMAVEIAKKLGFVDAKHYPGGWTGWEQEVKEHGSN